MAGRHGAPRVKHPHRPKVAPAPEQDFQKKPSQHRTRRLSKAIEEEGNFATSLTTHFLGISATFDDENKTALVAIAVRDSVYLLDFSCRKVDLDDESDAIADHIISEVQSYERVSLSKFIGAGLPSTLYKRSPTLCSKLWLRLDVVPVVLNPVRELDDEERENNWSAKGVDEQADSMARKCIMTFGPSLVPILQVGYRGIVNVDSGFHTRLLTIDDFKSTCGPRTWDAMMKYVNELKGKGTKIAFFSSTPQGGGVALMRHALVRLAKTLGLNLSWYVPKPKPGIFRITKTIHNILQGVAKPNERISDADKDHILGWIEDNAERYWFSEGGPLRKPEEGGADVIMIDDPQMPGLIPLIKKLTPDRPVLFRSHIQIRSDLVAKQGSPQEDVWEFLWSNIQKADMFISHPIPSFVPHNVPHEKVAYLPAATDWLDGLNKPIDDWSQGYYGHLYNEECRAQRMTELKWPGKKYIVQIARFDPAKGIPDVVEAYAEFVQLLNIKAPDIDTPQLVICGNSSIDDPDGTIIYDETMNNIETRFPKLLPLISVMRLNPNDQLLNTLLTDSHIVLQLSTREGFEVKVSEAIHKGKPVIATLAGGIPLQVQHEKNGFLVDPGDWKAVAKHLLELWTNEELYEKMSQYALHSVSDEVGTVGNALSWFYLASKWANGEGVTPNGKWVNDLAREEVGFPYVEGETKLPRSWTE